MDQSSSQLSQGQPFTRVLVEREHGSVQLTSSPVPTTCCRSLGGRGGREGSEGSLIVCHPLMEGAGLGVEFHGQVNVAVWLKGIETEHSGQFLVPRGATFLVLLW